MRRFEGGGSRSGRFRASASTRRAGAVLLAALVPASALALDPGGWFPFGPSKALAFSALLPIGAALVLRGGAGSLGRSIGVPLAGLLAVLGVAAAVGLDPIDAWTGTPERMFGWLTWALCGLALVAGASLDVGRDGPVLATGVVVAGVGVGAVATAEAFGWAPGPIGLGGDRLTGTYGSAAYLGAAAALFGPVLAGVAADRQADRRLRAAAAVGAAGLVVALFGSGARAAWLGTAAGTAVLVWSRRRALGGRPRAVLVAGMAAVAVTVVLLALTPVGGRVRSLGDPDAPGGRGRIDEWRVGVRVLADHPVLGVGPEGYRIAFGTRADDAYERAHGRDPLPDRAHSGPLDLALAGGPLALLAWVALVVGVGRRLRPALARGRPAVAGTVVAFVAHVVGQLVLFPLAELEPVTWLLAGAALAAAAPGSGVAAASTGPAAAEASTTGADHRRPVPTAVVVGLVVVGLLGSAVAGLGVLADRRAERSVEHLAAGDGPGAVRAAVGAAALRPDVVRYRLLEARARVAAGEGQLAALAALDDAAAVSPGDPIVRLERVRALVDRAAATRVPAHAHAARTAAEALVADDRSRAEAWRQLGRAEALDGDPSTAVAALERAAYLAPHDPEPLVDLAEVDHALGRDDAATTELDRALDLAPDHSRARALRAAIGGAR